MARKKTMHILIYSLFVTAFLWLGGRAVYQNQKLKNEGIYVLAKRSAYRSGGKQGGVSDFSYYYKGESYIWGIRDMGILDKLIFLKISKTDPSICKVIDQKVPECFQFSDVPFNGWKRIPVDTCK